MSKQNTETKTSNTSSTNSVVVFTDLLGIINHTQAKLSVDSSSFIHIASPLTKEMISKNNEGGRNYNGYDGAGDDGTIKTISRKDKKTVYLAASCSIVYHKYVVKVVL